MGPQESTEMKRLCQTFSNPRIRNGSLAPAHTTVHTSAERQALCSTTNTAQAPGHEEAQSLADSWEEPWGGRNRGEDGEMTLVPGTLWGYKAPTPLQYWALLKIKTGHNRQSDPTAAPGCLQRNTDGDLSWGAARSCQGSHRCSSTGTWDPTHRSSISSPL